MSAKAVKWAAFAAALVAGGPAFAAEGKSGSVKSEHAASGGNSGAGGSSSGGSGGNIGAGFGLQGARNRDTVEDEEGSATKNFWKRYFQAEVGWEAHRLFQQDDLEGSGADKFLSYYYAVVRYNPTDRDQLSVRGGVYQRFLADSGESGIRADDVGLSYRRYVPLPAKFDLFLSASLTLPTSYASQLQSLIMAPRGTIKLDRFFGQYVWVSARTYGEGYIQRYTTSGGTNSQDGANPNPVYRHAVALDAEVSMPFHPALVAGASLYTGVTWYYNVGSAPPSNAPGLSSTNPGATSGNSGNFSNQPFQQSYGGEIFVRYNLPAIYDISSSISLSLANGDPTLGYGSRIHDGVSHLYFFGNQALRHSSEAYAVFAMQY